MSDDERLKPIRDRIDDIDVRIQELINERAACAHQVAVIKQTQADQAVEFYRPEREADILRAIKARNQGPMDDDTMAQVFRSIISACLSLEQPMNIAVLGPAGTFSHQAALKHFGPCMRPFFFNTIRKVFREVESRRMPYGVIPIENSTEGIVNHTLDMFIQAKISVVGEVILPIHHNLLVRDPEAVIQRVYSHQQAFAQCRQWLDDHLPDAEHVAVASTAHAAKLASEEPNTAAIASEMAAELYQLHLKGQHIEDTHFNSTRFLVIGHRAPPPSEGDKTSLALSIPHKPGALARLLQPFAEHDINITLMESRPSHSEIWSYVFFLDIEGHQQTSAIPQAIQMLLETGVAVKVLGSYPKAVV